MEQGSYALLVRLEEATIRVGALGELDLDDGFYAYSGSAFGPGGLERVDRHARLFKEGTDSPHWHIDYLATHPASELVATYVTRGADLECAVSRELPGEAIPGFGCSDCECDSHLVHHPDRQVLEGALADRHEERYRPPGL